MLMAVGFALATESSAQTLEQPAATAPMAPGPAMAEYQRRLAAYTQARQKFDEEADAYWSAVAQKRRLRNAKRRDHQEVLLDDYVLTQPPLYAGPPRPLAPPQGNCIWHGVAAPSPLVGEGRGGGSGGVAQQVPRPTTPTPDPSPQGGGEKTGAPQQPLPCPQAVPETPPRKYIPVVADFLKSAQDYFGFVPQRPRSELEFKRAYAKLAFAAGLTREQVVRIYVFETGGNGTYDAQAGREYSPHARAISPALGYNQLLNTNSVELLAERGDEFVSRLKAQAAGSTGEAKQALERKIDVLRRMIKFCRTVPDDWYAHDVLANTPQGLGVHAMLLDLDIGPLLQAQKLLESAAFARLKGHHAPLTAAELEMMNLTGDGNGLDIVMMPAAMRERVPTANFFLQPGYERNPVATRNNVVARLLAVTDATMDRGVNLPGAKELAAAFVAR